MSVYKYRVYCSVDEQYEYVWDQSEPTVCPANAAHAIDTAKTTIVARRGPGRLSVDGAQVVKQDPGTEDTDPMLYPHALTVPASAGTHWFDLDCPEDGSSQLQYITIQVKNPVFGDIVEVAFRSNGTQVGTYGAEDTVVASFGGVHPVMHVDASGWGVPRREPQDQGNSKLILDGLKVSVKYEAIDATGHDVVIDAVCHQ